MSSIATWVLDLVAFPAPPGIAAKNDELSAIARMCRLPKVCNLEQSDLRAIQ